MIASISQKMELKFWDMVIVMLTGSQVVRSVVAAVMRIYQNKALTRKIAIGVVIACAGFATGILAFTFASFF
jgi:hypothetical protein